MSWALALQLFAAVGGIAGISSLVNLLISKTKVTAEAADIEQNISNKILTNINSDNEKLRGERDNMALEIRNVRAEFESLRVKMGQYEVDQWETRMLVIRLINWSKTAYDELVISGSHIESPPTLELMEKFKDFNRK